MATVETPGSPIGRPVAPPPPSTAQDAPACPHCAASRPGGRLTMRAIGQLVAKHVKLERGLLHTLVDLLVRPGVMLSRYLGGQRGEYLNPVTYVALAAAFSLLTLELYRDELLRVMTARMKVALAGHSGGNALGTPEQFSEVWTRSILSVAQHTTFTSMAMVLPTAAMLWLAFRRTGINVAESLATALYMVGTGLILHSLLVTPIQVIEPASTLAQLVGLVLYLFLPFWIGIRYFGWSMGNAGRMAGATIGGYLISVVVIYTGATAIAIAEIIGRH